MHLGDEIREAADWGAAGQKEEGIVQGEVQEERPGGQSQRPFFEIGGRLTITTGSAWS
jgi:hypothetical protein